MPVTSLRVPGVGSCEVTTPVFCPAGIATETETKPASVSSAMALRWPRPTTSGTRAIGGVGGQSLGGVPILIATLKPASPLGHDPEIVSRYKPDSPESVADPVDRSIGIDAPVSLRWASEYQSAR